jgi:hypothetical protein
MRKVFFIQDKKTLNWLQNKNKVDCNSIIIFLNTNFIYHKNLLLKKKNTFFYDNWVSEKDQKKINIFLKNFLFKWNVDKDLKDLSKYNNFSIGNNFNDSIRIFAVNFLKEYYSYLNFLKKTDKIYFFGIRDHSLEILLDLKKKIKFKIFICLFKDSVIEDEVFYKKVRKPSVLMRDYINFFYNSNYVIKFKVFLKIYSRIFLRFFLTIPVVGSVLVIPGGKQDEFKNFLLNKNNKLLVSWVLHLSSLIDLFKKKNKLDFYLRSVILKKDNNLTIQIKKLLTFVKQKKIENLPCKKIFFNSFSKIFTNQFCASYFQYLSDYKYLKKIKPKLCIITSDNYPDHIIFTQAARNLGIKTAFYPHGLTGPGETVLRKGKDSIFDYFFAFGKYDFMNFKKNDIDDEQIFITNNQYFQKFIPYKKKMNQKFNKCLILDYEIYNDDPFFKVSDIYNYRNVALSVAKSFKTKVVCIKSREEYNLNYEKKINYEKDEIPIYYRGEGYSFKDLVKKVDFVIGPPGTAMIEAFLSNVPFFPVEISKLRYKKMLVEKQVLLKFIYYSKSKKDLKYNIENKKFLKKNFCAEDFSDLNKLKNKDLYYLMEKAVYRVIND